MLKLNLQFIGHLIQRANSLEKTLMLGKIEGRRRRGQQRTRWLAASLTKWHEFEQAPGDREGQGILAGYSPWGHKESDTTEWLHLGSLSQWCESNHLILCLPLLFLPSIFPSIRVFSNKWALWVRWPKYWSFSISPSNEYSELISFRIDWFDCLNWLP